MENKNWFKYTLKWEQIGILLAGFFVGQMIAAIVAALMVFIFKVDYNTSTWFQIAAYVLSFGCPILFFDLFVTRPKGNKLNFNFASKSFYTYVLIFSMMLGMMLISEYLTSFIPTEGFIFGPLYKLFEEQMNSISIEPFSLIIMVAVLAPIFEEILFRGIIMKGMLNNKINPYRAIVISAFIFGAVHFYPWQFLGAFLLGMVLGLVYWKTKSLLLPMLMHAFNNFIAAMLMIFVKVDSLEALFKIDAIYLFGIGILIFSVSLYLFLSKYKTAEGKLF
ncbi:CPBP family intramembrane glutamic endopeptidase [Frigoriflavimonas asaccharolytica]|uniref:CAAX prenyl protease 2/Lysostaphin resistance protein A-like domain-containing protein n=1 Tax=Frigoriflavimonas asaccharolytica TaxID=2735899 RepID=A0A8J8KAF9_9FLAO|nr:type II CAAX endopeptidase family protein [Frigoriflavimonas asaccharolytica]NRS91444.1 hypothetical protein [Frigoriflavimonas asaccharolytica]